MASNIVDYIQQRRRWLFGHFQTKQLTGEYPTVMNTLVFKNPKFVLRVLHDEIRERFRIAPFLVTSIMIESVIYVLAILDQILGREYTVWPVIRSTKIGDPNWTKYA